MSAIFAQECPVCGRTVHVNCADTNSRVICQHCNGAFVAWKSKRVSRSQDWRTALMQRADELLALVATQTGMMVAIPGLIMATMAKRRRHEYVAFLARLEIP